MKSIGEFLAELSRKHDPSESTGLMEIQEPASQSILDVALSDNSTADEIRGALIYLFILKENESLKILGKIFRTGHFDKLKGSIVELLVKFGTPRQVDTYILLIRRGSILDREKLLDALLERAETNDGRILKLMRRYLVYGDQRSRLIAVNAIERRNLTEFEKELIYLLQKETAEPVRSAVIKALAKTGDRQAADILRFVAENDRSPLLRQRSREVLSAVSSRAASPSVMDDQ